MSGKPGTGGPVPKPQAQRRRRNKDVPITTSVSAAAVPTDAPAASDAWPPAAQRWYTALADSGQAGLYQASDWSQAWITAQMIANLLEQDRPSAQLFTAILQSSSSLLVTEGERRRLRIELARGPQIDEDEQASVTALDTYRAQLGG